MSDRFGLQTSRRCRSGSAYVRDIQVMPTRVSSALRRARNSLPALVVVVAGVVSALSAIVKLTRWVSIAAAVAAVLAGSRVLLSELIIPLRLDAATEATGAAFVRPADSVSQYQLSTAFHIGHGRWIT